MSEQNDHVSVEFAEQQNEDLCTECMLNVRPN